MKYRTLFLFLFLPVLLSAQAAYCDYGKLLQEGRTFAKQRNYKKALYKYNSARKCNPDKGEEVDQAIEALLDQVEGEKKALDAALKEVKKQQLKNERILSALYSKAGKDKFKSTEKGGKFGLVDSEGKVLTEFKYDEAISFDETGFAKVKYDSREFFVDTTGQEYPVVMDIRKLGPEITAIDLSNQNIDTIPSEVFSNLQLKVLLLKNCGLKHIPEAIQSLSHLQVLNLSDNFLTQLPGEIENLKNLTILNLSKNNISVLTPKIGQLISLQTLNLSHNYLKTLPAEIAALTHLQFLDIRDNNLETLPPQMDELKNLIILRLFEIEHPVGRF